MDATEILRWDHASLVEHGVEDVHSRLTRVTHRDGDTSWEFVPRLRNVDGSMPTLLAVELALLDEDGIEYASWANAVHAGNGPTLKGLATTRVVLSTPEHESTRIVEARAKVRPGAPHSSRTPLSLSLDVDEAALIAAGHQLKTTRATCRTSEWSAAEIEVSVAVRSHLRAGAFPFLMIYALDAAGLPTSSLSMALDPDPGFPDVVIGLGTFPVPAVPHRLTLAVPDPATMTRINRAWDIEEL